MNTLDEGFFDVVKNVADKLEAKISLKRLFAKELAKYEKKVKAEPGGITNRKFDRALDKLARQFNPILSAQEIYTTFDKLKQLHYEKKRRGIETFWDYFKTEEENKIMRFKEFLAEEYLEERLIAPNNFKKYNQIIILSGGAASGKGFAAKNFINGSDYKIRDVDEMKKQWIKLANAKNKYPEIADLKLKNPDDVRALHAFVDKKGTKEKTLRNLASVLPKDSNRKPNLIFDITGKSINSINGVITQANLMGYEATNIHLIWVLANFKVAFDNNLDRERVVPEDIFLQTHSGAANTMIDLIGFKSLPKGIDGEVWVIMSDKNMTVTYPSSDNAKDKENVIIKEFPRIWVKKAGKRIGEGVLDYQKQLFTWIIKSIPRFKTSDALSQIFDRMKRN